MTLNKIDIIELSLSVRAAESPLHTAAHSGCRRRGAKRSPEVCLVTHIWLYTSQMSDDPPHCNYQQFTTSIPAKYSRYGGVVWAGPTAPRTGTIPDEIRFLA